jgi:Survival motor neuron protein (SMN)
VTNIPFFIIQMNLTANSNHAKRVKKAPSQSASILDQESRASTRNDATPVRTEEGEAEAHASWYQYPNNWPQQAYDSNASSAPPPPPPPPMSHPSTSAPGEDEALSNLMMAWYYSGYYTGYYQAMRKR